MKKLILFVFAINLLITANAQESYIPIELKDIANVQLELRSPITLSELNVKDTSDNELKPFTDLNDQVETYNAIGYRLINHELTDGFSSQNYNVSYFFESDKLNQNDSCRFIIKSRYNFETQENSYFIFDTKNNLAYNEFETVEKLLKAMKYGFNFKISPTQLKTKTEQQLLDEAIKKNFFKKKKSLGNGGKYVLGGALLAIFQVTGIVLSNFE